MTGPTDSPEALDAAHEPCPTPLGWQDVVRTFHAESAYQEWPLPEDRGIVPVWEFGEGPPLVLFPPLTGSPLLYALMTWLLKEDFRCVLFDHPIWSGQRRKANDGGTGESNAARPRKSFRPAPGSLIEETASAWAEVLTHRFPQEPVNLYAPTFGGQVALALLAGHPQLVKKCVLQTAWARRRLTFPETCVLKAGRLTHRPCGKLPLWLRAQLDNHRRWFPPFDETRFGFLLQQLGDEPADLLATRLLASGTTDLRPRLPQIPHEVLLLRCEGDGPVLSAAAEEILEGLPRARLEEMALSGHFPYLTHPHRLVKVLRTFFQEADFHE